MLAAAGILDGHKATTHWMHLDTLRMRFPKVRVIDEGIYVKDRDVWTSAGVTAGIDLMLALVEEDHGHPLAMSVAKRMVLFLKRSGYQAQFSTPLRTQEQEAAPLSNISTFVLEHIDEDLPVERLALEASMSSRTLRPMVPEAHSTNPPPKWCAVCVYPKHAVCWKTTTPAAQDHYRTRRGWAIPAPSGELSFTTSALTPAEYRQRFAAKVQMPDQEPVLSC